MALVNRWPLTAEFATRDVVSGLTLTNNGGVGFSSNGAAFNGNGQWLSGTKQIPSGGTLTAWIIPVIAHGGCIIYSFHAASQGIGIGCNVNGNYSAEINGQLVLKASCFNSTNFPSSTATLVAFSMGSSVVLYRNNVAETTVSITPAASQSSSFAIGAYGGTNYANAEFQGNILDARIYDHALTAGEVTNLYVRGPWPYLQIPNDGVYNGTTWTRVSIPEIDRKHSSFSSIS